MGHQAGAHELPGPQYQPVTPVTPQEIAWTACTRHGAMQNANELAEVLRLVSGINPQVIVEIGCMAGGTLYAWRQVCDAVYGVTLPMPNPDYPRRHGASVLLGDSHDSASVAWLLAELAGRAVDVLHIDGDHSYGGVRADWEMYSPLVRPGGLILIHDVVNDRDAADVGRFWRDLTAEHGGTVINSDGPRPIGFGAIVKGSE